MSCTDLGFRRYQASETEQYQTDLTEGVQMQVEMKASPNPDYDGAEHRAKVRIKAFRHTVDSFKDASRAVRHFINTNELGSGNWTGGRIFDDAGKVIGRVSYNGRVWALDGSEIQI